ncbi:MAG: glycosyltransferase, partial [Methylacidiphilaceae bacterium]|nr:glycosyltransferase [Candidatus Methylacidiphilaceae bacterium]
GAPTFPEGLAIQRSLEELSLPDLPSRFVWYELFEAVNSLKPFGFRRLFADGFDAVLYLDADIKVYSELLEAREALSRHALLLTPHLTRPLPQDDLLPTEAIIRHSGSFNGGFLAMRNTPEIRSFLDWWERTLALDCLPSSCHDQAWLNYAPCFVSESMLLRHPGYNLAYWNLPYRGLSWEPGEVPRCAGGLPVRFFHFSAFDWRKPEVLSGWDTRLRTQGIPSAVSELLKDYVSALRSERVEQWSQTSCRLGLSGGYAIPSFLRDWLRQEPAFQAVARAGWQGDSIEEAVLEFFQLPDRTYPWLPIFLGRALDSIPGLRRTFPCESGFFLHDLATWFESVGRNSAGFGSLFSSHGWWTQERGWEKHLRRGVERWLQRRRGLIRRRSRFRLARSLRNRLLEKNREVSLSRIRIDEKPLIHVYGYFLQRVSLAESALGTIRALKRLGYRYRAIYVRDGGGAPEVPDSLPLSLPGTDAQIAIIHGQWNQLRPILNRHPEIERFPKVRVAYWAWELEEEPPGARDAAALVDEIWCPSEFNAAVFRRCTDRRVRIAWHSVDAENLGKEADPSVGLELGLEGKCVFLAAADFFGNPNRKNPLLALRAYLHAFPTSSSDRLLLLKLTNFEHNSVYLERLVAECSGRSDVRVFQSPLPRRKMLGLLFASTALISLHSSEGFGLPIAEMLSLGKPVVATAYGGNMDYCTPGNTRLVDYRRTTIMETFDQIRKGAVWAEPLWHEAIPHLQAIYQEWLQGDHRKIRLNSWLNERSFAMYAENLRALERLLHPESIEIESRTVPTEDSARSNPLPVPEVPVP